MRANTMHELGVAVRGRRRELGWSQAVAAMHAGVSRKWVSDFERGRTGADLTTVLRLLDALGLRLDVAPAAPDTVTAGAVDLDALLAGYQGP